MASPGRRATHESGLSEENSISELTKSGIRCGGMPSFQIVAPLLQQCGDLRSVSFDEHTRQSRSGEAKDVVQRRLRRIVRREAEYPLESRSRR